MKPRIVGILLFIAAAALAFGHSLTKDGSSGTSPTKTLTAKLMGHATEQYNVKGFIGGEKRALLANEDVTEILTKRYGIHFDYRKAGSIEMVTNPDLVAQHPDLFWPSSQVAREIAVNNGLTPIKDEIIFNSPIILYSWTPIAEALVEKGIAKPMNDHGYAYSVDLLQLLTRIKDKTKWTDMGVDELYSTMMLFSTDPTRSNSGNQFAALSLALFTEGDYSEAKVNKALDILVTLYRRMGYMEHSSSDLFEQYLRTGIGAKPIIAGYENQLLEFANGNQKLWKNLENQKIRPVALYPEPTVFSSHILLAMTKEGGKVAEAMMDEELQSIAWKTHGFRSGFAASNNPDDLFVKGVPQTLGKIIPMPPAHVIEKMIARLSSL